MISTSKGNFFLKMNDSPEALDMFQSETAGLKLLADSKTIKIPEVIFYAQAENVSFLLLEFIERGYPSANFWKEFGTRLAALHQVSNSYFGLNRNNYIGSLPQQNNPTDSWVDFFINERLKPQLNLAKKYSVIDSDTLSKFEKLYKKLPEIFPEEPPSLIHGDLWNGNFLTDKNGQPVLIDPSVCFAHREMDLVMSQLFGGFDQLFYDAYNAVFPIQKHFDQRIEIYQLYYLMVHVNLFSGGYLNAVKSILKKFTG